MNRRKEILIFFASFVSLLAIASLFVSLFVFESYMIAMMIAIAVYVADVLLAFSILNSSKRSPNVKMCWIFVILGFPLIGFALFAFFGINPLIRVEKQRYRQTMTEWSQGEDFSDGAKVLAASDPRNQAFAYVQNVQGRPIYAGNGIEFLERQSDTLRRSLELVRSAKKFIHAEYYIISDGVWLRLLANELIAKARAGVKVRFIYDWVGSYRRKANKVLDKLRKAGVMVAVFNRKTLTRYTSKTNFRCHRKCLIVDNEIALYGGSNVADEYVRLAPGLVYWEDFNVVLTGRAVNTLNIVFALDWMVFSYLPRAQRHLDDLAQRPKHYLTPRAAQEPGNAIVQILEKSPNLKDFSTSALLASVFASATTRLWIATPYFLPDESVVQSLCVAASAGVDVRVVLPGLPDDKKYILTMNRSHYEKLRASGVKIFEFAGFMHSKMIVVDDDFSIVTTMNLDFRSLFINYESAMLVKSPETNARCREIFAGYLSQSSQIDENSFTPREMRVIRFKMSFMNVFHPLL